MLTRAAQPENHCLLTLCSQVAAISSKPRSVDCQRQKGPQGVFVVLRRGTVGILGGKVLNGGG